MINKELNSKDGIEFVYFKKIIIIKKQEGKQEDK